MRERSLPHDLYAEESLLGALLLSKPACLQAIEELGLVTADFFAPKHQTIYAAIVTVWRSGLGVDPVVVADELRRTGTLEEIGGSMTLLELQNATPTISAAPRYAAILRETHLQRMMLQVSIDIAENVYDQAPFSDLEDLARKRIDELGVMAASGRADLPRLFEGPSKLVPEGKTIEDTNPWVMPGFLREQEIFMAVGTGGAGKSTLLRQGAFCVENGIHIFSGDKIAAGPQKALVIEGEAKRHNIYVSGMMLQKYMAWRLGIPFSEVREPHVAHMQGGFDLRNPVDRSEIVAMIRRVRPKLVCVGPLKYMFDVRPGERDDQAALIAQKIMNDICERYSCALMIETHASRADHKVPAGSERWVDWPDVGVALSTPEPLLNPRMTATFDIDPFRVPRNEEVILPSSLLRNSPGSLPWAAGPESAALIKSRLRALGQLAPD